MNFLKGIIFFATSFLLFQCNKSAGADEIVHHPSISKEKIQPVKKDSPIEKEITPMSRICNPWLLLCYYLNIIKILKHSFLNSLANSHLAPMSRICNPWLLLCYYLNIIKYLKHSFLNSLANSHLAHLKKQFKKKKSLRFKKIPPII